MDKYSIFILSIAAVITTVILCVTATVFVFSMIALTVTIMVRAFMPQVKEVAKYGMVMLVDSIMRTVFGQQVG